MKRIGLIGLGLMGLPMARNLIAAGYEVVGYRRGECNDFSGIGGKALSSCAEVAAAADIILSCIPDDEALRTVISGPSGIASIECTGKIVVELSTLTETVKQAEADYLARRGGTMLDGSISGLPPMVAARSAVFYLGGDETAFDAVRPVVEALTTKFFFMGAFGTATRTKLCANLLVAANLAATAEMLTFGAKQGLELDRLVAALSEGAGSSVQFKARASKMAQGDWDVPLGKTGTLAKDLALIALAAEKTGCPLPVLAGVQTVYDAAMRGGWAEKDVASIYAASASAAGLPVPGLSARQTEMTNGKTIA